MITVDQGFIWTGHQQHQEYIWTFPGYEQAFKGRHIPPALGPFLAIFGYVWGLWCPPKNLSGPRKRLNPFYPDLLCPYQTLNNFYQPFCGLQGYLWLQRGHFWPISVTLTAYGAPQRRFRTQEKAQTYCYRCALALSNLDQV